jgi:histone demethylase JARID1
MSSLSTSLKNSYQKWLCPYEDYLRVAKPGVHQQLEMEYGGPLTPSPGPSPLKRSNVNTPASLRADSPARLASDALQASLNGPGKDPDQDTPMADASPLAPPAAQPSSGFRAINSGGFTAVNSGFTSVNRPLAAAADSTDATPTKQASTPLTSAKNTPEVSARPHGLASSHPLKRQLSVESLDSRREDEKDDADGSRRTSKRLKKGT